MTKPTLSPSPIEAVEEQLRQAMLTSDVATLDRLIDDDLFFTALSGEVVDKATDLEMHRSGRIRIRRLEPSERRIRLLGSTAVVSVRMAAEAVIDGTVYRNTLRYTRVWHEGPAGWRIAAGHMGVVQE